MPSNLSARFGSPAMARSSWRPLWRLANGAREVTSFGRGYPVGPKPSCKVKRGQIPPLVAVHNLQMEHVFGLLRNKESRARDHAQCPTRALTAMPKRKLN